MDDPAYQTSLLRRLRSGSLPGSVESLLWHYAFGKPKDGLLLEAPVSSQTEALDLSCLSEKELVDLGELLHKVETHSGILEPGRD